jgi:hypothetical protein
MCDAEADLVAQDVPIEGAQKVERIVSGPRRGSNNILLINIKN